MYFSSRQESSVTLLAHLSQNFLLKINDRAPLYKYSITGSGVRKERKYMDLLNWHLQKQAGSAADVSAVYSRLIFRVILDSGLGSIGDTVSAIPSDTAILSNCISS